MLIILVNQAAIEEESQELNSSIPTPETQALTLLRKWKSL